MEDTVLYDAVRTNLDRLTKQTSTGELPLLGQLEDARVPSGESGGGGRGYGGNDAGPPQPGVGPRGGDDDADEGDDPYGGEHPWTGLTGGGEGAGEQDKEEQP